MIRSSLVNTLQSRLGTRTALETLCVTELQLAQTELESDPFLPWFLEANVIDSTTFVTVANTRTLSPPTGFLRLVDEKDSFLLRGTSTRFPIAKKDLDILLQDTSITTTGEPEFYAQVGMTFYLFPTPTVVYNGSLHYYTADTVLSTDASSNNWSLYAPELLIARAGISVAQALRDAASIKYFTGLYSDRLEKLKQLSSAIEESGRTRTRGDSF